MKHQVFKEKADIAWLFMTHIQPYQEMIDSCAVVEIFGNEDSPEQVNCYARDDWQVPAFAVFVQNNQGNLILKQGA